MWKTLCKRLKIDVRLSTAYHPETDGQTERANQDVERGLRTYVNHLQDDWVRWLPMVEFADNDAISSSTGLTPFYLNKGFNPRLSFGPDNESYKSTRARLQATRATDIAESMERIVDLARVNMTVAQKSMAKQANKRR